MTSSMSSPWLRVASQVRRSPAGAVSAASTSAAGESTPRWARPTKTRCGQKTPASPWGQSHSPSSGPPARWCRIVSSVRPSSNSILAYRLHSSSSGPSMATTCSPAARKASSPARLRRSATVNPAGSVIGSPPCRSARVVVQDRQMAVPAQRCELVATVPEAFDPADRHQLVQHPGHKPDLVVTGSHQGQLGGRHRHLGPPQRDRKSTRLNSSHVEISYAVFCLKKKKNNTGRLPLGDYAIHLPLNATYTDVRFYLCNFFWVDGDGAFGC